MNKRNHDSKMCLLNWVRMGLGLLIRPIKVTGPTVDPIYKEISSGERDKTQNRTILVRTAKRKSAIPIVLHREEAMSPGPVVEAAAEQQPLSTEETQKKNSELKVLLTFASLFVPFFFLFGVHFSF